MTDFQPERYMFCGICNCEHKLEFSNDGDTWTITHETQAWIDT